MHLAVDPHSDAYQFGSQLGQLLMPAIGVTILWITTRKWRNPYANGPEDHATVMKLRSRRNLQVVLISIGIIAAGLALPALRSALQPRATGATTGDGSPTTVRTMQMPPTIATYNLVTGDAAAAMAKTMGGPSDRDTWFYAKTQGSDTPAAVLSTQAAPQSAPALITRFLDGFFTSDLTDIQAVDAGPLGGEMRCGTIIKYKRNVCAWADSSMNGYVMFTEPMTVKQAADLTLQVRNAGEH